MKFKKVNFVSVKIVQMYFFLDFCNTPGLESNLCTDHVNVIIVIHFYPRGALCAANSHDRVCVCVCVCVCV